MKKILISFTLFVAFSFSLSAQMVLQAKIDGLSQYEDVYRAKLNKSGEKLRVSSFSETLKIKVTII